MEMQENNKSEYTLEQVLEKHTVAELKQMSEVLDAEVGTKARKQEYIEAVSRKILDGEWLKKGLLAAGKQEIVQLESAISGKIVIRTDSEQYFYWRNLPVVFVTGAGEVIVPTEIAEAFERIKKDPEYTEKRERIDRLDEYLLACVNLYRVIDVGRFLYIVNSQTGLAVTRQELQDWLKQREEIRGKQMYFYQDGYLLSEEYRPDKNGHSADYHEMLERQGNMEYYIPQQRELLCYADPYYIDRSPFLAAMKRFLIERLGLSEKYADLFACHIQLIMRHGAMPKDIFDELEQYGLRQEDEALMSDFITVMMNMYNNTRMPETRGFTTLEAQISDPSRQKKIQTASEVVTSSMPILKDKIGGKRIYPNDLCPCGSGKKYKQCCGRKK